MGEHEASPQNALLPVAKLRYVRRVTSWVPAPSDDVDQNGTCKIDHCLPRGDEGCPFIFELQQGHEDWLAMEIRTLPYDTIMAVDIGGDSLTKSRGRDAECWQCWRKRDWMLRISSSHPGIDGESEEDELESALLNCRDAFSLECLLPSMRPYAAG